MIKIHKLSVLGKRTALSACRNYEETLTIVEVLEQSFFLGIPVSAKRSKAYFKSQSSSWKCMITGYPVSNELARELFLKLDLEIAKGVMSRVQ